MRRLRMGESMNLWLWVDSGGESPSILPSPSSHPPRFRDFISSARCRAVWAWEFFVLQNPASPLIFLNLSFPFFQVRKICSEE
ncbi:hypothetical protein V6N13_004496 [Hibiscus sabdariffa]